MKRQTWQLQDAKNRFSQVVDQALENGAQIITRHGEPAAVVLSIRDYDKLRHPRARKRLVQILRACPVKDFHVEPLKDTLQEPPL
jgi:prevent-host-death family protein